MCTIIKCGRRPLLTLRRYVSNKVGGLSLFLVLLAHFSFAQITISFTTEDPSCKGLPNGSITANPTGGSGTYTYLWASGQSTQTISNLTAGTYTVTVTDANSNTATASISLIDPDEIEVAISADVCDLPIIITAQGSAGAGGPYTYRWGTGESTSTIAVTESGQYCVTVTDANSCGRVACISVEAVSFDIALTPTDVSCFGGTDGAVAVTTIGGSAPYTYAWSNGSSSATATNLPAGTYTVTVTDANNCVATRAATVGTPPELSSSLGFTDPVCVGDNNGTISVIVNGGTPGYSYLWNTGQTSNTLTGLPAGFYSVTVTDANSCTVATSVTLNPQSSIQTFTTFSDESCPDENDGTASVVASNGVAPYSYLWENGATTATISNLAPGSYRVTATDALGCQWIDFEIIDPAPPLEITSSKTDITTCGAADGTAKVVVDAGVAPLSYDWSNGAITDSIGGLFAGTYYVTVTDANECQVVDTLEIIEPPAADVGVDGPGMICAGTLEGYANAVPLGGTAPYTFLWNTGATTQTIDSLPIGTYTVTMTDAFGCTDIDSTVITALPALNATVTTTEIVCGGRQEGEAVVTVTGGTAPFSYSWLTGDTTAQIVALGSGEYTVTVSDINNCTVAATGRVTVIDTIMVDATVVPANCAGEASGAVYLMVSGDSDSYTYNWDTGTSDSFLLDALAGTYTVEVIDTNQCSTMASFTVTEPTPLSLGLSRTDVACGDQMTSSASVSISGGVPPYAVNWSNGALTDTISGVAQGVYIVTVTDANECMAIDSVEILDPGAPFCTIDVINPPSDPLASDGELGAIIVGGTAPYSYLWSTGETTTTIDSLPAGNYSLTVTDALGCQTTCNLNLSAFIENGLVGDFAWLDANGNGLQDPGEEGIAGIPIVISRIDPAGLVLPDTIYTDENGEYMQPLPPGDYQLTILVPDHLRPTTPFVGDDSELDSDFSRDMAMSSVFTVELGVVDMSRDIGFVLAPEINITQGCVCLNNATNQMNGQFEEELTITNGVPGDVWEIISHTGMYLPISPDPPVVPTPVPTGTPFFNENGQTSFTFRHLDAIGYQVRVSNGFDTLTVNNTCAYPEIVVQNIVGNSLELCQNAEPFTPVVVATVPGVVDVFLDSEPINEIDPGQFEEGTYELIIELTPFDPMECVSVYQADVRITREGCYSTVGDYVWFDENRDGIQDPSETGVAGVEVVLTSTATWDGSLVAETTYTDANGYYQFETIEGSFTLAFTIPDAYRFTTANSAGATEATDSDVDRLTGMTEVFFLPAGVDTLVFDAGLVMQPTAGGLPACNCLNNATTADNGQFEETIIVEGVQGETWQVIQAINAYTNSSLDPPATPTPLPVGVTLVEASPGIFELVFKHVDGEIYDILVTNGVDTLEFTKFCTYPEIEIAEIPGDTLVTCLNDAPFMPTFSSTIPGEFVLTIDGQEMTEIDPLSLGEGMHEVMVSLLPSDDEECLGVLPIALLVTQDVCPATIGNHVWLDENEDGIQNAGEPGIAGVQVQLSQPDGMGGFVEVDVTITNTAGDYSFEVPPGDYKLTFVRPGDDYFATAQDIGTDELLDSDIDPNTLMTAVFTVGGAEANLGMDAGFYRPCINLDYAGRIGYDQTLCAPGYDPEPILETSPPRGGEGEIEYLWMKSVSTGDFTVGGFSAIEGATGPDYDPGPLDRTTYFVRCTRIVGCEDFLETNTVTITVNNDAKADIIYDPVVCYQATTTLEVVTNTPDASVYWIMPGGLTYSNADLSKKQIEVGFSSFGSFVVGVRVTENDCQVTSTAQITATATSTYCDGINFAVEAEAIAETQNVRLDWQVLNDGLEYSFEVEQSADGDAFAKIAEVSTPDLVKGGYRYYSYTDVAPKMGRNVYRIEMKSASGASTMSNAVELMLFDPETRVIIYPNPVQESLMVEFAEKPLSPVKIELVSVEGVVLRTMTWQPGTIQEGMDFSQLSAGLYLVRIQLSEETTEVFKILKRQ